MEGLILEGPERIVHRGDLPDPRLESDRDALVAVRLAGLCGSDLHPYQGREPIAPGTIPGHEFVGTVIDAGDAVEGLSPGALVLAPFTTSCGRCHPCRRGLSARCGEGALFGWRPPAGQVGPALDGAQAALVRVPLAATTLVPVPSSVSPEVALLLGDNFTTGWSGAEGAGAGPGRSIAVVGCGAVGLAAVSAARQLGSEDVVAIDLVATRRDRAATLGATALSPDEVTGGVVEQGFGSGGFDGVVEAVGRPSAQRLALSILAPGGTIAAVGVHAEPSFSFAPGELYDRNATYRAGRCPVRSLLDSLLPEVAAVRVIVPAETMISDRGVPLADGPDAYRRFAARTDDTMKVVFTPGE